MNKELFQLKILQIDYASDFIDFIRSDLDCDIHRKTLIRILGIWVGLPNKLKCKQ